MTAVALKGYPLSAGLARSGASAEATTVQRLAAVVWHRIKERSDQTRTFNDLEALKHELETEGSTRPAVTPFELAHRFLLALPSTLPVPELSVDPDGELAFDWFGRDGRNFSVSLNASGRVSFAGRLRPGKSIYGTDQFDGAVPREILEAVVTLSGG